MTVTDKEIKEYYELKHQEYLDFDDEGKNYTAHPRDTAVYLADKDTRAKFNISCDRVGVAVQPLELNAWRYQNKNS